MGETPKTAEGWFAGRDDGADGWKGGPYSWKELVTFVREGRITADDLVWHESLTEWVRAGNVPGLFESAPAQVASPAAPTAPAPPAAAPPVDPTGPPPGKPRRTGAIIAIVAAILVGVIGAGGAWAWSAGLIGGSKPPSLGTANVTLPDRAKLIKSKEYGEVPANQIIVSLAERKGRRDADRVAEAVGGEVVGEIEYIGAYQIAFSGTTEADLLKAISTAKADESVESAFANQQVKTYLDIKGVRIEPYDDPMYTGEAGQGYKAAGVPKAWTYIKGAGVDLHDTHVGIVDEGLYSPGEGRSSEFGGDVNMNFPDPAAGKVNAPAKHSDGTTNTAGTHGTGVATIIGADPGNGGPAGIAGPLGKKLTISMIDHYSGGYGDVETAPDPNDPSQVTWSNGKTYAFGSLVALKKEIESGAKVINCSWGADVCSAEMASAYKKFFEKMATDHPDVTFVCAAGNTGGPLDNRTSFPSGHNLPNMITVGAVDNDGTLADYSTTAGDHYVVDLAAPGTGAIVGMDENGQPVRQDGTSFSAPHVTAAIAMLLSINPKLTAAEVKDILIDTAREGTTVGEPGTAGYKTNLAPGETGGKVLAIDAAVLKVINDLRAEKGLPELDPESIEKLGVIDAVASTGEPGQYNVRAIVGAVGEKGTQVRIAVSAESFGIGGDTTQMLDSAGELSWDVTLPEDEGVITVTRLDNGAGSRITVEKLDINGNWAGTFTITSITVDDQKAAKDEGCSLAIISELKGKAAPMTMDVTADEGGSGSATMLIDYGGIIEGADSEPYTSDISFSGGVIKFQVKGAKMSASVKRNGDNLVMSGSMTSAGKGYTMKAVFSLSKPAE